MQENPVKPSNPGRIQRRTDREMPTSKRSNLERSKSAETRSSSDRNKAAESEPIGRAPIGRRPWPPCRAVRNIYETPNGRQKPKKKCTQNWVKKNTHTLTKEKKKKFNANEFQVVPVTWPFLVTPTYSDSRSARQTPDKTRIRKPVKCGWNPVMLRGAQTCRVFFCFGKPIRLIQV